MKENAVKNGIFIDFVNGYSEHCHCLISLKADQSIQKIMQLIKGESARWINKNSLSKLKFEWQDEYWGTSVSPYAIPIVRNYIKNQEEHHAKNPDFKKELEDYKKQNNFTCYNSKSFS
jgi:REP element-mobilizing transposase RayT